MNNRKFGEAGEELACRYLQKQGYEIIARNIHYSRFCEIDIIAMYKNTYIFVEVKTRHNNDYGSPLEAITRSKFANIKKGVLNYLAEHNIKYYRIDAIGITMKPEVKIEHLRNIIL